MISKKEVIQSCIESCNIEEIVAAWNEKGMYDGGEFIRDNTCSELNDMFDGDFMDCATAASSGCYDENDNYVYKGLYGALKSFNDWCDGNSPIETADLADYVIENDRYDLFNINDEYIRDKFIEEYAYDRDINSTANIASIIDAMSIDYIREDWDEIAIRIDKMYKTLNGGRK